MSERAESFRNPVSDSLSLSLLFQNDICPNSCLFTNMYFGPPVTGTNNQEDSNVANGIFYFRR